MDFDGRDMDVKLAGRKNKVAASLGRNERSTNSSAEFSVFLVRMQTKQVNSDLGLVVLVHVLDFKTALIEREIRHLVASNLRKASPITLRLCMVGCKLHGQVTEIVVSTWHHGFKIQ